jgi:TatD DNase family protein
MSYIDAHCHLDLLEKEGLSIENIIKNIRDNDLKFILTQGVDIQSNRKALELSNKYEEIKACLGMYPIDALDLTDKEINSEIIFIKKNMDKIYAIGEIGLDLKDKKTDFERQKKIFGKFVKLAMEINVSVIVHSRKAEKETIELLEELGVNKVLMHCFSGKMILVDRIVKNGWFLSIPANVKYSQQFQDVVKRVPTENLLCETDSPYLHPNKDWPNTPENVKESYKKIAEIKGLSLDEVEKKIEMNFKKLFLRR